MYGAQTTALATNPALGFVIESGALPVFAPASANTWVAAHTWSGQYTLGWHARAGRHALVRLDHPKPEDPTTWGIDPEQIEIATLAALERVGTQRLDRVELTAIQADAVITKENLAALRELSQQGLIGSWSLHARTAKQYMRGLSFLGIEHLSVDRSVLETVELSALLAAADRAHVALAVHLPPRFGAPQLQLLRAHPQVEIIFPAS